MLCPRVGRTALFHLKPSCIWSQRRQLNLARLVKGSTGAQAHTTRKRFDYSQDLIYQVVSSVDEYHKFIPYCKTSFITERDSEGQPTVAGLDVGFKDFDEVYTCDLHCERPNLVRAKSITHTLFRFLETEWTIAKVSSNQCDVEMRLRYEFKNPLYNQVSSIFADKISTKMTRAFERRAYDLSKASKIDRHDHDKLDI